MVVTVHLHTTLQRHTPDGRISVVTLDLPDSATVEQALQSLAIEMDREAMILVVNHRIADSSAPLSAGDRLDIVPAISGGRPENPGLG